jgi:hypothetical protein
MYSNLMAPSRRFDNHIEVGASANARAPWDFKYRISRHSLFSRGMIGNRVLEAWGVAKNDGKREYEEEQNEPGCQPVHQARGPIEDPLLEVVRAHRSARWRPS